ncbi:MAG: CapA family protein [Chloroflexi bacterium]|nr:CapA family protein [Chloroflexota bacterium]
MTEQAVSRDTVMIHAVGNVAPRHVEYGETAESLFGMVQQKIKEADIAFCHLRRNFSSRGCVQYRETNTWESRVDPENVKSLVSAGFNVVSYADNRCFDWGPDALLDSIDAIRKNGMQVVGAGKDIAEARQPVIVERKGVRVGFLAYNTVLPVEYEAREEKPGCAPIRIATYYEAQGYQPGTPPKVITLPREEDVLAMEEDIRKLRNQADAVLVSMHWGLEITPEKLCAYQPGLGHRAIDAGADLILGHFGLTIGGIEVYKGKAIFYSLSSFANERAGKERNPGPKDRRYLIMVKCAVSKNGMQRVSFVPGCTNQKAEPELLSRSDPRFQEILDYAAPRYKDFGTAVSVEGDEVVVYNAPLSF